MIGGEARTTCSSLDESTNRVWMFDWELNQWSEFQPMQEKRISSMCGKLKDGRILVAGGTGSKSTEIYDPKLQKWTLGEDLPSYWENGHMVSYKDTVLIVNGWTKMYQSLVLISPLNMILGKRSRGE